MPFPFPTASLRDTSAPTFCAIAIVDEQGALMQFRRCLAEEVAHFESAQPIVGCYLDTIPLYIILGAILRARLARLLRATGFRLIYSTYRNSLLFPFMVISRKLFSPERTRVASRVTACLPVDMRSVVRRQPLETILLRAGLRFPFGGSVLAIAAEERRCRWLRPTRRAPRQHLVFALSIVIPVFNGAGSVAELIGALENLPDPWWARNRTCQ